MDIVRLGHSAFKLKGKNATLVADPFDEEMVGLKFPKVEAQIVTISHDHKDHNAVSNVEGNPYVISGPGEYEVSDVFIKGIQTFHDEKEGSERGKNTIYAIEIDKLKVAHLGDLGHQLTDEQLDALGDIDILLIPTGGIYTINPEEASEVITKVEPRIVIPMHYKEEKMKVTFDDLKPVDEFLKEIGKEKKLLPKLSVTKDKLPQELEVVVLE